jgi:hypothetical protein
VKDWAVAEQLVVDTEDSMAVVLAWWCKGPVGRACRAHQLKELAGLLRVKHKHSTWTPPYVVITCIMCQHSAAMAAFQTGVSTGLRLPPVTCLMLHRSTCRSDVQWCFMCASTTMLCDGCRLPHQLASLLGV